MALRRLTIALLVLYALLSLLPAANIALGGRPIPWVMPLATLAGFSFALLHAGQRQGWEDALRLLALVFGVSLLFESVGVVTGLIYGPYHYTGRLGPLFLGLVPYLIPVAWFMVAYPSFVIADLLIPSSWERPWRLLSVAAVGGLAMTAWDLVMDPLMVSAGYWIWEVEGAYHGIPLQNFAGWWLTTFTAFALYLLMASRKRQPVDHRLDRLALTGYLVATLGIGSVALASGAGGLALTGLFTMLPWAIAAWLKTTNDSPGRS